MGREYLRFLHTNYRTKNRTLVPLTNNNNNNNIIIIIIIIIIYDLQKKINKKIRSDWSSHLGYKGWSDHPILAGGGPGGFRATLTERIEVAGPPQWLLGVVGLGWLRPNKCNSATAKGQTKR